MKERPISFNDEMVRAILDGRKTVTRRPLKVQPIDILPMKDGDFLEPSMKRWITLEDREKSPHGRLVQCRYGQPGERLWVRETWCHKCDEDEKILDNKFWYRATDEGEGIVKLGEDGGIQENKDGSEASPWQSSATMPRKASRLALEITSVTVERLCRATQKSLMKEGLSSWVDGRVILYPTPGLVVESFAPLWDSIYAKKGLGWDKNPWVWVIEFKRIMSVVPPI